MQLDIDYNRDLTGPNKAFQASPRALSAIAREIKRDWAKPYFGAVPYLDAMRSLVTMADEYGADSARSIVAYFLSNATSWRGETARRVKAELNAMLKAHRRTMTGRMFA